MPDESEAPNPEPADDAQEKARKLIAEMDETLKKLQATMDEIDAHRAKQTKKPDR